MPTRSTVSPAFVGLFNLEKLSPESGSKFKFVILLSLSLKFLLLKLFRDVLSSGKPNL
jgi:hypothetical protein